MKIFLIVGEDSASDVMVSTPEEGITIPSGIRDGRGRQEELINRHKSFRIKIANAS
jgi:hypothetical protein